MVAINNVNDSYSGRSSLQEKLHPISYVRVKLEFGAELVNFFKGVASYKNTLKHKLVCIEQWHYVVLTSQSKEQNSAACSVSIFFTSLFF